MFTMAALIIVAGFGLILGSFTSALSFRVARGLPWKGGRSICPSCGTKLSVPDLIPIFSYLVLRGKCRHCGRPIGPRYPLIELAVLAACLCLYAAWGRQPAAFLAIGAVPFLATLLLVDLDQMILPDSMQVFLAGLGVLFVTALAWAGTPHVLIDHAAAAILYAAIVWIAGWVVSRLRRRDALGLGDVKFFAIAGLWLGVTPLPFFLMLSGVTGLVFGLAWRFTGRGQVFPFGPAIIIAFYLCLLAEGTGFFNRFGL